MTIVHQWPSGFPGTMYAVGQVRPRSGDGVEQEKIAGGPPFPRASRHPLFMHYHRLIVLVLLINGALLGWYLAGRDWHVADQSALSGLASLIVVNFAIAVLIRQQHVLNVIFALAGRGSSRWPLRLRWTISKAYHIGGLHVGAALAGTAWLCGFTVVAAVARTRRPACTCSGRTWAHGRSGYSD